LLFTRPFHAHAPGWQNGPLCAFRYGIEGKKNGICAGMVATAPGGFTWSDSALHQNNIPVDG
jgi:hypothetical protein